MLRSGELRELLVRDVPGSLALPSSFIQQGGTVREGPAAEVKGAAGEGTRPALQDYDAVITAESLPRVAAYLRDRHGYTFLSNITAVDYLLDGLIEVVYHFFAESGGGSQTIRVRVPRDNAVIPTLTGEWPGANLQEREAYDLYGVHFPGHPYLKRIYMWDEFEGYPMRKDFPKTGDKYTHETGAE